MKKCTKHLLSETWLMMGKDKQRVSQQASELACALALAKSCDEVSNPYHRFLRETVEEGSKLDVLRELGGYEEALEKMGKALRKGMVRESSMIDDNDVKEEEGVGWLALKMFGAKEVEKLALSHEDALKICLSGNLNCFTAKLSKLMIMSSRFLLRGEDLLHDGFVSPILFLHHDANFSKAMILARAVERFIKDGGVEGGNTAIEAWKNGIGEEMSLEEGREYYRNHPVMKLVTEVILKTSMSFCRHSALHIERVISTWEKTDVKKRKWDQLCQDLNHSKRLKDKGREGAEEPRPVRNLNQHSLKDSL